MRIRIAWKSRSGVGSGHGEWLDQSEQAVAKAWVKKMNEKSPDLIHWIETEREGDK